MNDDGAIDEFLEGGLCGTVFRDLTNRDHQARPVRQPGQLGCRGKRRTLSRDLDESPIGPYETLSAPFHIRGADIAVRGPAPLPGEHTQEILQEFGFDDGEIAELAADGVFG